MIYLVTNNIELFENDLYKIINLAESLSIMNSWKVIQVDSETTGKDAHINDFLCVQFGNDKADIRLVVDTSNIDIRAYKDILESRLLVLQNAKFDLQFFYNYGIVPRRIYDTMIVEQMLYLGFSHITMTNENYDKYNYDFPYHEYDGKRTLSFALDAIAYKRLGIKLDKSVRGEIIYRGLDSVVINYAALDVTPLEKIMWSQVADCKKKGCLNGAKLECDTVPAIAYLEWCGIKLDEDKWMAKMAKDKANLNKAKECLDAYLIRMNTTGIIDKVIDGNNIITDTIPLNKFNKFIYINRQGDLFNGFDCTPKVSVNWSSSSQVATIAKLLGFNTVVQNKKTGEDKDSVIEKHLAGQKGINDRFLDLYFKYQEYNKVVTSFGQGHLNAINPKTGRIHTVYRQLGAASGRMSCGSNQPNTDLAKYKNIPAKDCTYPNIQQLPHDEETRACFIASKGNKFISCDYSAQEGRMQGSIYQDAAILKMYREGIDGHSMYAKIFFKDELADIDVHDVKKLRPDLRSKAKSPEFALAYGAGYQTIMQQLKCSEEEALKLVANYEEGFKGTIEFARKGSKFVRTHGYILICPDTGHKMYWWDFKEWLERQNSFTPEFWEDYRLNHKNTHDSIATMVRNHFQAASKYDRLARNAPPQGSSACMTKVATTNIFNWIVDSGYFGKILCCALVHDETNWEFPEEVTEFPNIVKSMMEEAASKFCKLLPIPAEASVGDFWIH